MKQFRQRLDGKIVSETDLVALLRTRMSFSVLTPDIIDSAGFDPIFEGPRPSGAPWQHVIQDGVEKIGKNWHTKFKLGPEFPSEEEEDTYVEVWTESHRAAKLSTLADRRWQAEVGGTTFNGIALDTTRDSQMKITAAYIKASQNANFTIANWKVGPSTFITLDAPTIIAIGDAVTAHVQACFTRESELSQEIINATDYIDINAVDIETGWPS